MVAKKHYLQRETGVLRIWSSGKHPRALIGLKVRHNSEEERRARRPLSPPPTVFSKAPCRPTALSSHNGILGLSSNYLRDKRSDDVEWRKITSRSHGERLLLVEETAQNRDREHASTREGAVRISAVRSAALVRALHVLQTIGDCTLYLIDSPQTCVTTTRYCL